MRTFIALVPDASALRILREHFTTLRRETWAKHIRWTAEPTWHLTLRFLGEISSAQAAQIAHLLRQAAPKHPPFDVTFSAPMWFPTPAHPRVVACMCLPSPALNALAHVCEAAAQSIGLAPEPRGFRGHITLGRVADGFLRGENAIHQKGMGGAWLAGAVTLFKSDLLRTGAVYTNLGDFELGEEMKNKK